MKWPLLGALTAADAELVLARTTRHTYAKGEAVFWEGDRCESLFLLDGGHVAVQVATFEGETAWLRVIGPGGYFGELAMLTPGPRNATVIALDPVETLSLRRDDFDRLRAEHPSVEDLLVEALVREVRRLSTQVRDAYYLPAPGRVLRCLADLVMMYQAPGAESSEPVTLPFTQEALAQLVGIARPTANKVLHGLQADSLLAIGRGTLTVTAPADLLRRAENH